MADLTRTRMTAAEFAALPESNTPHELLDGEVVVSPTLKQSHQKIVFELAKLVENLVDGQGQVCISPLDVYLDERNVVQPDLFWVSGPDSLCKLGDDDYWHGAPDLAVEVLSPATARRDRVEKFLLYETRGAREYWIVESATSNVEVWQLTEGKFARQGAFGPDDAFESAVLGGKQVQLAKVFKGTA